MSIFKYFNRRKEEKCTAELTKMMPGFVLDSAKDISGSERVHDRVAFHSAVLGFLYGYSASFVFVANKKLGFDEVAAYRIIYRGIADAINRSEDVETVGYYIIRFQDANNLQFREHEELGQEFCASMISHALQGDAQSESSLNLISSIMKGKLFEIQESIRKDEERSL